MAVYVSLLKGINVGGNKILKMQDLIALYESMSFKQVSSLLNSGNLIFESSFKKTETIKKIEEGIQKKFKVNVEAILLDQKNIENALKNNPFKSEIKSDPSHLLLMFLKNDPNEKTFNEFKKTYEGPEKMILKEQVLFLYYGTGMAKSKLTNVILEKKLETAGTARNWNTTTKILERMKGLSA